MRGQRIALLGALLCSIAACSGGGGSPKPPGVIPTTISWTPVTQSTDGEELEDITSYSFSYVRAGETPTQLEISADTTSVTLPLQSGAWTFSVWAHSTSRGPGEAAMTTKAIN